jgi:hypothetical protein
MVIWRENHVQTRRILLSRHRYCLAWIYRTDRKGNLDHFKPANAACKEKRPMMVIKAILILAGLYLLAGFSLAAWIFHESRGEVGVSELVRAVLILPVGILAAVLACLSVMILVLAVHDKTLLMIESEA